MVVWDDQHLEFKSLQAPKADISGHSSQKKQWIVDSVVTKLRACGPKLYYQTSQHLWKTKENLLVIPVGCNLNIY